MENNKVLEDNDVLALYRYLFEYEKQLKNKRGQFNIYDENILKFKKDKELFLGSINREDDKKKAKKSKNYLLWKEGSLQKKHTNVDRAHALLRRIRNAFAHGDFVDNQKGFFLLKDVNDNQEVALDGVISYNLLYQFVEELKNTFIKN